MALQKNLELESGAIATYHSIKEISIKHKSVVWVTVACYMSSAAKDAGKIPAGHLSFYFPVEVALEMLTENSYAAIYTNLKATPEFAGATDC
jgi:hypothetical protein